MKASGRALGVTLDLALLATLAFGSVAAAQQNPHAGHSGAAPANPQAIQDRQAGHHGDRQGRQAGPAASSSPSTAGSSPATSSPSVAGSSPATAAFAVANARMHKDMAMSITGGPDLDFARSMVPDHQGAIDMARIMLEHGRDPEMRKLAETIFADREKEIALIRA
jgi:hypothetical protein